MKQCNIMKNLAILGLAVSGFIANQSSLAKSLGYENKIEDSSQFYRSNWMENLDNKSATLSGIVIPGIHHPESYSFRNNNPKKWSTQYMTIYQQLMFGARYFDMRPKYKNNELVGFHNASSGNSYNTFFRHVSNFVEGFDPLVVFGEYPHILKLTDNSFILFYSSHREQQLDSIKANTVNYADTQNTYYRFGQFNEEENNIVWQDEVQYNGGKARTPSSALESENLLEVHEYNSKLYYTPGSINDNKIELDGTKAKKYTDGVQPVIASLGNGAFLEVHKSQKYNRLFYTSFYYNGNNVLVTSEGRVGDNSDDGSKDPFIMKLSDGNLLLLYTSTQNGESQLRYRFISKYNNSITIGGIGEIANSAPAGHPYAIQMPDGRIIIGAVASPDKKPYYIYSVLDYDSSNFTLSLVGNSYKDPININPFELSLFAAKNDTIVTLNSDSEHSLHQIWYQPLSYKDKNLDLAPVINKNPRNKEIMIFNFNEDDQNITDEAIDYLANSATHFLGRDKLLSNDDMKKSVAELHQEGKQYLILFNKGSHAHDFFINSAGNQVNTWHGRSEFDEKYQSNNIKFIQDRTSVQNYNKLYVLQTETKHTDSSKGTINSNLRNSDYQEIKNEQGFINSLLNDYHYPLKNFNIIESNFVYPSYINYVVDLNDSSPISK